MCVGSFRSSDAGCIILRGRTRAGGRTGGGPAPTSAPARAFRKGGEEMPELLEELERLAREGEDPEGLRIAAQATCKHIDILSHYWDALQRRLRAGGLPAKLFLSDCDKLLGRGEGHA